MGNAVWENAFGMNSIRTLRIVYFREKRGMKHALHRERCCSHYIPAPRERVAVIPRGETSLDQGGGAGENHLMTIREFTEQFTEKAGERPFPALFIGHGSPANGLPGSAYGKKWGEISKNIPTPKAILVISAHWLTEGTRVHIAERPRTIYDFYGFPKELYNLSYPCPGDTKTPETLTQQIRATTILGDRSWGIDHGAWVPLLHLYRKADIPVFQMSIDITKPPAWHSELGRELGFLRERGVLIVGSGNIVHNLREVSWDEGATPYQFAIDFDSRVAEYITRGDTKALVEYEKLGAEVHLSVPTPDHYLPLLYILSLKKDEEGFSFPVTGIAHGSISMRAVLVDQKTPDQKAKSAVSAAQ